MIPVRDSEAVFRDRLDLEWTNQGSPTESAYSHRWGTPVHPRMFEFTATGGGDRSELESATADRLVFEI